MQVEEKLYSLYDNYYADGSVTAKRLVTAKQTVGLIKTLSKSPFHSVLDVGSGDGAALMEMSKEKLGSSYSAIEISSSGIEQVKARNIPNLKEALLFDGYKIPFADNSFDLAIVTHVLEHVEHERAFIRELLRVAKRVYIELPLDHTLRIGRTIQITQKYGHINFYTPETFRNILATSGAKVESLRVFSPNREYEILGSGKLKGSIKFIVRSAALKMLPRLAPRFFSYLGTAIISKL